MEGRLGDEAVGEGEPEDSGYARGEAEQEDIPVETGGFAERELGALGDEGGYCKVLVRRSGRGLVGRTRGGKRTYRCDQSRTKS